MDLISCDSNCYQYAWMTQRIQRDQLMDFRAVIWHWKISLLGSNIFSPIPRSYSSFPLDGAAGNFSLFFSTWICKITQFIVAGYIYFPTSYAWEEKNHLVWAGTKSRSYCFTGDHSNHKTMPPREVIKLALSWPWCPYVGELVDFLAVVNNSKNWILWVFAKKH